MILHIISTDEKIYNICKEFAIKLSQVYSGLLIRLIEENEIENILNKSNSDGELYIDSSVDNEVSINITESKVNLSIPDNISIENILAACKTELDSFISTNPVQWVKNEKGWWYQIDRVHNGGIEPKLTTINGIYYCFGKDYYMMTGWQPVEIDGKFYCVYLDDETGAMLDPNVVSYSDMPDPFSFPYPPFKMKSY